MAETTTQAQTAKNCVARREPFELRLQKSHRDGDDDAQRTIMNEYHTWEVEQAKSDSQRNPETACNLCRGLFERALCGIFAQSEKVWLEYVVFLSTSKTADMEMLQLALQRAAMQCPWSGKIWNRNISVAEEAGYPFSEVEAIKNAATNEEKLYEGGMERYRWCC